MTIAITTTFPSNMFDVYAKDMLQSLAKYLPPDICVIVQLDDNLVEDQVRKLIRSQDAVSVGWTKDHLEFVQANKAKDDPTDYRKQCVRFCHKVFAISRALEGARITKKTGGLAPRYLIWWDADAIINRPVTMDEIKECLPKEAAVSYMGRKDWPHSECGFMAFDLDHEGDIFIDVWHSLYTSGDVLKLPETHDSWAFDVVRTSKEAPKCTNLTEGKPGMDIWQHSPMGKWSTHFKGPVAKMNKQKPLPGNNSNVIIQTRNSIPNDQICAQIAENQKLIKNWITECEKTDEQICVVSAGPQLIPELDVMDDYKAGKKIIAVKHALKPLRAAGIRPWACILLDPRPHVYDFVDNPDTDVLWFVASQVNPKVTAKLLAMGCTVWGYHASVGAGEGELTKAQPTSIIDGGSATATRGLFLLHHLGFHRFKLFGYDLCYSDKPTNMAQLDEYNQPKYMEMNVGWNDPLSNTKRHFWTEPQLVAQFEEINALIKEGKFEIEAHGDGIVPFIVKTKKAGELRRAKLKASMVRPKHYSKLLRWNNSKKTNFLMRLLPNLRASNRRTN